MLHMRHRSPSAAPKSCLSPQPQGRSPAKHHRLQEPVAPEMEAPDQEAPKLEAPAQAAQAAQPAQPEELTSIVFLAPGCAMQLQLEDVDLMLEPNPTSVLKVSIPGHTFFLVPEGLQSSVHLGQPGLSPAHPQGADLLDLAQDHLDIRQQGSCEYILDFSYPQDSSCDEDSDSSLLSPWMDSPPDQATMPSPWTQGRIPEPNPLVRSSTAERCSLRSVWGLNSSLRRPFPSSPLQPLPPSPPSPQGQGPPCPPCPPRPPPAPCKARKRLFRE